MLAQSGELLPVLATVGGAEQCSIFDAGIDGVGIGQRRFQVPNPLELPRMRCTVVPLVSAGHSVIDELVPDWLPRLSAVVRALNQLARPTAGLRRVQSIGISGRSFHVVDLPASQVR